jgi:hypothetical protein
MLHAQDPLAKAPLEAKVKSIELYLGSDLVQFRIQVAAEQLMREGRSLYADEHSVHVDQTGNCFVCFSLKFNLVQLESSVVSRS